MWRGFLVVLAAAVVIGHALGGWYYSGEIVDRVFTPPAEASETPEEWLFATPDEAGLDVTEIQYDSPIGPMDAWVTDGTRSEWVVHVHGRSAGREEALRSMTFLDEAGYHQMAITYRNDPGQPVAYAIRQPIGTIAAMVFDSPNLDLEETVDFGASQERLAGLPLPFTLTSTAKFFAALRTDINWRGFDYLDRSEALSMPVLIFHGTEDMTVPLDTSRRLAEARSDLVRLVVVEGAGHVESYNVDPASYRLQVLDFLAG